MRLFIILLLMVCMLSENKAYASEIGMPSEISVKIYEKMDEQSNVVANVIQGSAFTIIRVDADADGERWCYICTDFGTEGYVRESSVRYEEAEETESKEKKSDVQRIETVDNVNVREIPSTDAEIVGKVPHNTVLEPLQTQENENGETWYQIEYEGTVGYIRDTAVNMVTVALEKEADGEEQSADDAQIINGISEAQEIQGIDQKEETASVEQIPTIEEEQKIKTEKDAEMMESDEKTDWGVQEPDTKTSRKWVNPIDKVAIMLILGMVVSAVAIIYILKKIRKEQRRHR